MLVSLPAVIAAAGLIVALLAVKMGTKLVGVWPLTRVFRMGIREGNYTTMLMSTGLTFGTISSLFGITHNIINQTQYSVLVTVVIGSAVVPTLIAQTFFMPEQRAVSSEEGVEEDHACSPSNQLDPPSVHDEGDGDNREADANDLQPVEDADTSGSAARTSLAERPETPESKRVAPRPRI